MSKETILSWDKPLDLVNLERERGKDKPLRSGLFILSISMFLHAVALFAIYKWTQEQFTTYLLVLFASSLLMPFYHYLEQRKMYIHTERHYEFRADGILYGWHGSQLLYRWARVKSYEISQNDELPQLRNLIIISGPKWSSVRCELTFDPNEIPEETISALLDEKTSA